MDNPVVCALYAKGHSLLDTPGWKCFKKIVNRHKRLICQVNQAKLQLYLSAPKYMFSYRIPRDYNEALKLDKMNRFTKWEDCTALEMLQLDEYKMFGDLGHSKSTPILVGYKKIRVHLVYAVKHNGRHKA